MDVYVQDRGSKMTRPSRLDRLLPDGEPKYIRIYDAGDNVADRYTVIFSGNYVGRNGKTQIIAMNESPTHPQGVCIHNQYSHPIDVDKWGFSLRIGQKNHLGVRIRFGDLPEECKKIVMRNYLEIWEIHEIL